MVSVVTFTLASLLDEPLSYGSESSDSRSSDSFKIVVFGDSLSAAYRMQSEQGWVALLDKKLQISGVNAVVANLSLSGETTDGGLARIDLILEQQKPEIVVVELGGNDGLRGYPVEAIEKNLTKIVEKAQSSGANVLLAGMQMPPNYGPQYSEQFSNLYPRVAAATGCMLIPFFLEDVALDFDLMQEDNIHPTAEAQPIVLENVWEVLEQEIRERQQL